MKIKLEKEQKLKRDTHCLGCELYSKLFGPECEFNKLIRDNVQHYVEHNEVVDCKRPDKCIKNYGL